MDRWACYNAKRAQKKIGRNAGTVNLNMRDINRENFLKTNLLPSLIALAPLVNKNIDHLTLDELPDYLPDLIKFQS